MAHRRFRPTAADQPRCRNTDRPRPGGAAGDPDAVARQIDQEPVSGIEHVVVMTRRAGGACRSKKKSLPCGQEVLPQLQNCCPPIDADETAWRARRAAAAAK